MINQYLFVAFFLLNYLFELIHFNFDSVNMHLHIFLFLLILFNLFLVKLLNLNYLMSWNVISNKFESLLSLRKV